MSERPSWLNTVALMMVMGGMLATNLAPVLFVIELTIWLRSNDWPLTAGDGLAVFGLIRELPGSGSPLLVHLALSIPLNICLCVVGLLLCIAGLNLGDRSIKGILPVSPPPS